MPRTLVISDLHLGLLQRADLLRRPVVLEALCAHLRDTGVQRLVLLGDTVELRHGPTRDALAAATPVLAALGAAVPEVVLVPGNHDHQLIAPWLEERGRDGEPPPLALDEEIDPASGHALRMIAEALGDARLEVRYPGVWLREDVYATHGHYLDCCLTMPTVERLAVGAMQLVTGPVPEQGALPDDFEAQLAPLYAWTHAVVHGSGGSWSARRQATSKSAWGMLTGDGPRPLRARMVAALFPAAIASLNRAGLGPVRPHLSGRELRQAGLRGMSDVVRRLDVQAAHVLFGHTHRSGPLETDPRHEWLAATGPRLWNAGAWVDEDFLDAATVDAPYYAGRAIELDDDGPPRLVRVTAELGRDQVPAGGA